MDGIFLSEELGVEKPNIEFLRKLFLRSDRWIDVILSLSVILCSSDIRGGNNAGILTCWYNPSGKEAPET